MATYREAPYKWATFFRLQVYQRVGNSRVEANEMVGKSIN